MGIYDDMFDLDDHFSKLMETDGSEEAAGLKEAWERVSASHAEGERMAMHVEPVIEGLSNIFNSFRLQRLPLPESEEDQP